MGMDRVDLGGRPPRPPTDPDVPVEEASGSSRRGAVPRTVRWFHGNTWARLGVLGVLATLCPRRGAPFAPRVREGPFPRFVATMGRCDSLPAISPRFVSFAWRYHRFVPVSSPQARDGSRGSAWILVSRDPDRQSRWRRQGLPSSRETRSIIRHVPPTPV